MAELLEPGSESPETVLAPDSAAVSLALERARNRRGKSSDPVADRFLARQEELVAKQLHHLDEQFRHLRLKHFSERLKVTLQLLTILAGAVVLGVLALIAWQASRAEGIVVDAFSVPPSYAAKGLTGSVVAGKVLDRLVKFDHDANPLVRTSVDGAWTENAKIELPETGLTIDEAERLLRKWLGHEQHVTGEVVETPAGVTLTARTQAGADVEASGDPANLAQLTEQLAEQVYARAQPVTYAFRMMQLGRLDESDAVTAAVLAETESGVERARAHLIRGQVANRRGDLVTARAEFTEALKSPVLLRRALARQNLSNIENGLGHDELALQLVQQAADELRRDTGGLTRTGAMAEAALFQQRIHTLEGDCASALADARSYAGRRVAGSAPTDTAPAEPLACLHEITAARGFAGPQPPLGRIAIHAQDWAGLLVWLHRPGGPTLGPNASSYEVIALINLGRMAEASAVAAGLPADCYECQIAHAQLAEAHLDRAGADRLFAAAVAMAPHVPTAQRDWGRVLLARGDAKGALAHAEAAVKITPRYHDALELAGEALAAQGDFDGAGKRYAEAARLAPRWGRLRLKWGEALARQGRAAEARAQFAQAATMDLTPTERAELAAQKV
jgi:tetratricopeptide (TPR) repeat protein